VTLSSWNKSNLKPIIVFDFLEKLRGKSDKQKKQIAFCLALLFAGLIFVVWLSVIFPGLHQNKVEEDKVANLTPSPFSVFMSQISSGISSIGSKVSEIKSSVSSFSTGPVQYIATSTATTTSSRAVIQ